MYSKSNKFALALAVVMILSVLFVVPRAYSQTYSDVGATRHISVDELFYMGLAHSLQVRSSRVSLSMAGSNVADQKSSRLPDINIALVGGYVGGSTLFGGALSVPQQAAAPHWNQNYNVELTETIYQGGRTKYSVERSDLQQQIAQLSLDRDLAQIKLLLMQSYLDLLRLYKQQQVIRSSISEARQRLHDIRGMERNGMVTSSDVLRSELQLSSYELSLTETANDIVIVSQRLDIALGLDEQLVLFPDSTLLDRPIDLSSTYDTYVEMSYSNYPEMKIANEQITLAKIDRRIVRSAYMPTLSVRAANTLIRPVTSISPPLDLYANNWNVGLSLSYNLASLYRNRHKVDMATYNVELQNIEQERVRQTIRANLKNDYVKHNESLERIRVLVTSVEQANENYRIVLNKYRNQIAILTDLLDASAMQLDAQLQLTTAKTTAVYTYYQLMRYTGTL